MVLTLYGSPHSTCTKRVAVVAKEAGVPFEMVAIDYTKGEHKAPSYLEKQPFGQVPYIVRLSAIARLSLHVKRYLPTYS
jgi:glutathione S-transferase